MISAPYGAPEDARLASPISRPQRISSQPARNLRVNGGAPPQKPEATVAMRSISALSPASPPVLLDGFSIFCDLRRG
jgi:hypothetical protein